MNGHNKVSIRTISSMENAFNKNGKYYKYLNIPLINNLSFNDLLGNNANYQIFFQKNNTSLVKTIQWPRSYYNGDYDAIINYGFGGYTANSLKSSISFEYRNEFNIFIMNYNEQ